MQVVWASSVEIGCGVATTVTTVDSNTWYETYIVCQYAPGGNVHGQTTNNVNPLIAGAVLPTSQFDLESENST